MSLNKKLTEEQLQEITGGVAGGDGIYVMINYSGSESTVRSGGGLYKGPFDSEETAAEVGLEYCAKLHEEGYENCSYCVFTYQNGEIVYGEEIVA